MQQPPLNLTSAPSPRIFDPSNDAASQLPLDFSLTYSFATEVSATLII